LGSFIEGLFALLIFDFINEWPKEFGMQTASQPSKGLQHKGVSKKKANKLKKQEGKLGKIH